MMIFDGRYHQPQKDEGARATLGYSFDPTTPKPPPRDDPDYPYHDLVFPLTRLLPELWDEAGEEQVTAATEEQFESMVAMMMHELGHAAGLKHEHQRPDRDDHVMVRCENLHGYKQAAYRASKDTKKTRRDFPDTQPSEVDERMKQVCKSWDLAVTKQYFPTLDQYLPDPKGAFHGPFDRFSIMIYGSNAGVAKGKKWQKYPALQLPERTDPSDWRTQFVYSGGALLPSKKSVSVGDICRIAMMYEVNPETTAEACSLQRWSLEGLVQVGTQPPTVVQQAPENQQEGMEGETDVAGGGNGGGDGDEGGNKSEGDGGDGGGNEDGD